MRPELVKVSKFLSLILRHKPEEIGLPLDAEGWADIERSSCVSPASAARG